MKAIKQYYSSPGTFIIWCSSSKSMGSLSHQKMQRMSYRQHLLVMERSTITLFLFATLIRRRTSPTVQLISKSTVITTIQAETNRAILWQKVQQPNREPAHIGGNIDQIWDLMVIREDLWSPEFRSLPSSSLHTRDQLKDYQSPKYNIYANNIQYFSLMPWLHFKSL